MNRHQVTVISLLVVAAESALRDSNIAVDLTESIKGETVNHHQSSIKQNLCLSLLYRVFPVTVNYQQDQ